MPRPVPILRTHPDPCLILLDVLDGASTDGRHVQREGWRGDDAGRRFGEGSKKVVEGRRRSGVEVKTCMCAGAGGRGAGGVGGMGMGDDRRSWVRWN